MQNTDNDNKASISLFDFGVAVGHLKLGCKVARIGWNGKGMWLSYVEGGTFEEDGVSYPSLPFIHMKTAQDTVVPWLASQTDVLAEDWVLVD